MNRGIHFQWDPQVDLVTWGRPLPPGDTWFDGELPRDLAGWIGLVDPEDSSRVVAALRAVASGSGAVQLHCRLRDAAGSLVDAIVSAAQAADSSTPRILGSVQLVPPVGAPIHRTADEADEGTLRPPDLAEPADGPAMAAPDPAAPHPPHPGSTEGGAIVVQAGGIMLYASRRAAEILGRARSELTGVAAVDVLSPGDRERFGEFMARLLQGESAEVEVSTPCPDGRSLSVQIRGVPLESSERSGAAALLVLAEEGERRRSDLLQAARQDPLTRLANRRLLLERLSHAIARARRKPAHQFALLFVDLDHMKALNDSLGHATGDQLLISVATRMRACVRPADTVARIGGDEFVVLLEAVQGVTDATRVAQRILQSLLTPIRVGDYELNASASIGVVLSSPDTVDPGQILRDADAAMYRAKAAGRGRFQIFDTAMHTQVRLRLQAEADLRIALDRDEFCLHYQPIVSLGSGLAVGVEALLRWNHPQRGLLAPPGWLGVAEETGAILPLDRWVLRAAVDYLKSTGEPPRGHTIPWVAINLSTKQFLRPELATFVEDVLRQAGVSPSLLRLEVAEDALMRNVEHARRVLERLRELGVGVHIDRFGTGSSSLAILHELPITALKLDRKFVEALDRNDHHPVVWTALAFAQSTGMEVIATGISRREQYLHLRKLGCSLGQGHLFSPPVPSDELEQALPTIGI